MLATQTFNPSFSLYISITSNLKTLFEKLVGKDENRFGKLYENPKNLVDYLNWCFLAEQSGMEYVNPSMHYEDLGIFYYVL